MRLQAGRRGALALLLVLIALLAGSFGTAPLTRALGTRAALAAPAAPAGPAVVDQTASDKLDVVREAFDALYGGFDQPLRSDVVLGDAWDGINMALTSAGLNPLGSPALTGVVDSDWQAFADAYRGAVGTAVSSGKAKPSDLAYGAINQMANARNSCHTAFLPPDNNASADGVERHQLTTDVGFIAGRINNLVYRVYPDGAAAKAGLLPGDTLLSSNGQGDPGIRRRIFRANAGQAVDITVQRPGVEQPIALTIVPEETVLPFVRTRVLPGGIGVIQWDDFTQGAGMIDAIRQAITGFQQQGVVGWVLDLRTSPGGDAHTMAAIASLFMPQGLIATSIDRGGARVPVMADANATLPEQLPMVVLIENYSASAADILPGALQDNRRAYLIGERSAGCIGSAILHTLSDGSGLQVEVEHILIGNDQLDLNGVGITPDETVVWSPEELAAGQDPQMDRAAQVLLAQAGQ
ncbi:MAG TPA: S41 family peptidase [Dehalococcoidia bacterium]|nr:S41 family peptidase [Dehalococcoidia bacterium]